MADNMSAYWIKQYKDELDSLGIKYPEDADKDTLKAFLAEAKGKTAAPKKEKAEVSEATRAQAAEAVKSAADARVAELEARMAEMHALVKQLAANAPNPAFSQSGISGDDLLKAVLKAADGRQTEYGLIREEYIPPGDQIPVRTYYCSGPTTNIYSKIVGGTHTPPPLGRKFIKFKSAYGWLERDGRGIHQKRVSTYACASKTIADWIESLPEFGRSIHLNMDQAMKATPAGDFMAIYNKHFDALQSMSFTQLSNLAIGTYGAPSNIGSSHKDYAAHVAEKRAWAELEENKNRFEAALRTHNTQQMIREAHVATP